MNNFKKNWYALIKYNKIQNYLEIKLKLKTIFTGIKFFFIYLITTFHNWLNIQLIIA